MATRTNCITYAFPTDPNVLAAGVDRDIGSAVAKALQIDESSLTFKSVMVDVYARQADVTNITPAASWKVEMKLGGVAFAAIGSVTDNVAGSGEHASYHWRGDATSYFTTNWSGSSMNAQVRVAMGTVSIINISVIITITYEYDDSSSATRTATAFIPLDSSLATLTNSLAEFGTTNQIPILTGGSGIIKENSPTIRDWAIVFKGNECCPNNNTDFALGVQVDAGGEVTEGLREAALASSPSFVSIYSGIAAVPTTTSTHTVKARCAAITARFHFAAYLLVTYSYNHSATTRALNSVRMGANDKSLQNSGTATGDKQRYKFGFFIEEPGTITLEQSGILLNINPGSGTGDSVLTVTVGGGSARGYTIRRNSITGGGLYQLMQRIDSGGAGGAGITLARGYNEITVDLYDDTAAGAGSYDPDVVLYLNYSSDLHSDGKGAHLHTIERGVMIHAADATRRDAAVAIDIPEAAYSVQNVTARTFWNGTGANQNASFACEYGGAEGPGAGWAPLSSPAYTDAEFAFFEGYLNVSNLFKRNPADPDTSRMDLETSRTYRQHTAQTLYFGASMLVTYHSIKWTKQAHFKDWPSGVGTGLVVTLHRSDTGEKIAQANSVTGDATFDIYDDTIPVWARGVHSTGYRATTDAVVASAIP